MPSIRLIKYDSLATIRSDIEADAKSIAPVEVAGTSYTITLADLGKLLRFTSDSTVTLTLPETATESIPAGFFVALQQSGTGQVVFAVEGADVLLAVNGADRTSGQYAMATVTRVATDTWAAGGSIE